MKNRDLIRDAMMFAVKDITGRVLREDTVQSMIDDFEKQLTLTDVSQGTEPLFCKCGSVKNGGYGCMRTDCDNTLQAFMQNNCG